MGLLSFSLSVLYFSSLWSTIYTTALLGNVITRIDLDPANSSSLRLNSSGPSYTTALDLPSAWPRLPWWTKIQESTPTAFLDVYSIGSEVTPLEAYVLQEIVLIPLSFKVYGGMDPAARAESIRSGGVEASYSPVEHRPPSKAVVAKAITALAFLEKRFGARTLKAGLRLGMVKVASIEVRLSNGETV